MPSQTVLPAAVELLVAFRRAMRRRGWQWYVFGAQAAVAYGRPRMTGDVDITVALAGDSVHTLLASLRDEGFAQRFQLDEAFLSTARLLPLVHQATAMPVDVLLAQPGLHTEILTRTRLVDIGGAKVPMIGPEDLVAIKIVAGRRKDLEDVRGVLLEQWDRLDLDHVSSILRRLEDPPGDTRLARRLARQLSRVRKMLGSGGSGRPHRR